MALYHLSYDAREAKDSEALRMAIPSALLSSNLGVSDISEPVRSTFRFVADGSDENRRRIFSIMTAFESRCFYFISCADEYIRDGGSYFKSKTMENPDLNKKFLELLSQSQNDDKKTKE